MCSTRPFLSFQNRACWHTWLCIHRPAQRWHHPEVPQGTLGSVCDKGTGAKLEPCAHCKAVCKQLSASPEALQSPPIKGVGASEPQRLWSDSHLVVPKVTQTT